MRRRTWTAVSLGAFALLFTWGVAFSQAPKPVRIAGVDWEPTLQQAQARAAREGKPIFLLHLFGRLDEEFC
ncbi:MAG: hypothetical protein ACO1SX_17860 [Actinomycetota bacterium]